MKEILGVKLYNMAEVCDLLGVTRQTVARYIKRGSLKAQTIGGARYISEEALKTFLLNKE